MKISRFFLRYFIGLCVLSVLSFSGCAAKAPKASGFLNDYSRMKPSEIVDGLLVDKSSGREIGEYSKFMVDPIEIYFHPDAKGGSVDPEKLHELTTYFRAQAREALAEHYEVVDEPGPGVLRIRAALTDVVPNKIYLNLHWATSASKMGMGGASLEAEFVDSLSGKRILAVMDARRGKAFTKKDEDTTVIEYPGEAFKQYSRGLSPWGHTKDILNDWVELLVATIDLGHADNSLK